MGYARWGRWGYEEISWIGGWSGGMGRGREWGNVDGGRVGEGERVGDGFLVALFWRDCGGASVGFFVWWWWFSVKGGRVGGADLEEWGVGGGLRSGILD